MPSKSNPRRRRGKKLLKGETTTNLVLSTLADVTALAQNMGDTVKGRTFALSAELTWAIRSLTVGEGPIAVGLAHSDYTSAEIEEYIENAGGWDEGDLVSQEISKRKIRHVGTFSGEAAEEVLNDGEPIKTTLKFILNDATTLKVWAYNRSGAALTTGAIVNTIGHVWLRPT